MQQEVGKVVTRLVVHHPKYEGAKPPSMKQPEELTCFHIDGDSGEKKYGAEAKAKLRIFEEPELPADLNIGMDTFVAKRTNVSSIMPILEALQRRGGNVAADVISFRNNFNKIMLTPYNRRDPWQIGVQCLPGENGRKLLLLHVMPATPSGVEEVRTGLQANASYWGYRFEAACTGPSDSPVNANEEFCTVVRTAIGAHQLILGAEIDCRMQSETESLASYVELKTSRIIETEKQMYNFRKHKLLKYWIQSFLVGVPVVVVGYRDDMGQVRLVKHHHVKEMARESVHEGRPTWEYARCFVFADRLLSMLKDLAQPGSNYVLSFQPPFQEVNMRLDSVTPA